MNSLNKIKYIVLFFLAMPLPALARQDSVKVEIKTGLDSSFIYINHQLSGRGSAVVYLSPGRYIIKASEPAVYWNAKSVSDTLLLNGKSKDTSLALRLNSEHYLETSPENAAVIIDDTTAGFTPLFIAGSSGKVILKKNGYAAETLNTDHLSKDENIKLNFTGTPESESFFRTDAFKILVGSIVLLGSGTAYFKLKADNRFDQYQATGEKSYLDQTRKLDVVSGIFMGALQINFGVLIYYFLTD